jgi:hypothetical protein
MFSRVLGYGSRKRLCPRLTRPIPSQPLHELTGFYLVGDCLIPGWSH